MQATIEMKIFQNIFKLSIFMIKQETYAVEKGNCDKNQSPPSHPLKYPTVPPSLFWKASLLSGCMG